MLQKANPFYLVITFAVIAFGLWLSAVKWQIILSKMGHEATSGYLLNLYYIGLFFSNFLPTSIGGDVVKVKKLNYKISNLGTSFSSTFMDRFTGLTSIFISVIVDCLLTYNILPKDIWLTFFSLSILGLILSFFIFKPSITKKLSNFILPDKTAGKIDKGFLSKVESITAHKKDFAIIILMSVFFQFLVVLAYFIAARALGDNTNFYYFIVFIPIVILASFIPVSLNGLGIREGALVFLFSLVGMAKPIALTTGLIIYFLTLVHSITGGFLYLLEKKHSKN